MLWEMATLAEQPYQGFTNDEVSRSRNNQDKLNGLMSLGVFTHPLTMIRRHLLYMYLYFDYLDYTFGEVSAKFI